MTIAVRIELDKDNNFLIKRINLERFSFHGFGSFIWKLKAEEVSISQEALIKIESRIGQKYTSQGDLAGFSLQFLTTQHEQKYNGYYLNYGYLGPELDVPLEDIIIDRASYNLLKNSCIEEDTRDIGLEDKFLFEEMQELYEKGETIRPDEIHQKYYQKQYVPKS